MNKRKCPICGDEGHVVKNGVRGGVQLYKCTKCGLQFRAGKPLSDEEVLDAYLNGKQTISDLSKRFGVSASTIKRSIARMATEWDNNWPLSGGGFVCVDVTYWGRRFGVLVAMDSQTQCPLYVQFTESECNADYQAAFNSIKSRGYDIRGIVVDGRRSLFKLLPDTPVQMCQFHMIQIVRRHITKTPKLGFYRELKDLVNNINSMSSDEFKSAYEAWKAKWKPSIMARSASQKGKGRFTHARLRSAIRSIDSYMDYLFTFERPDCQGMPKTNNLIEGRFSDLKKNVNVHSGMSKENRKRFILWYFYDLRQSRRSVSQ